MRRFLFALFAVFSAAAMSACSGGSGFNFGGDTPQRVIVTVLAPSNIARVLPGASLPLSAVAVNGSGNSILSANRFVWSAMLTTGQQYVTDTFGHTQPCASVLITQGGVTTPYTTDLGVDIAIDPTNEANILFIPPTILPNPTGATLTTNYPYCVSVSAQAFTGKTTLHHVGQPGSIIVAVFDPQNPLP